MTGDVNAKNKSGKSPLAFCLQWDADTVKFPQVLQSRYCKDGAAAIPICAKHWVEEHAKKLELNTVENLLLERGPEKVEKYLNARKALVEASP
ncbi:hypothetical protein Poli38472_001874 [Pythium oligandrum]|uniref:Uncharacterized protein n=1 Tax=Pythium oligandrum TaxID=41045 RepID=A0A8K1FTL9_PYTOL|nr:hypothetical protein Poli38472_001874 [Pythium oligandrum]|eukprot:TMW69718.1 hypothetical protein Poli38472_001874 [Pythium oligandrum]